jgi:hypothetical protein
MGRGRGRGGRRGGAATTTPTQTQTAAPVMSPLAQLIEGLLEQAYAGLPENERPKGDKRTKAIEEVEKTTKQIVASDHAEAKALVVSLSLTLSLGGILTGPNAKKVIGTIFTYLLSETTRYWKDYGLTKEQVHPSYVRNSCGLTYPLKHKYAEADGVIDCNQEEYTSWLSTFTFLTPNK